MLPHTRQTDDGLCRNFYLPKLIAKLFLRWWLYDAWICDRRYSRFSSVSMAADEGGADQSVPALFVYVKLFVACEREFRGDRTLLRVYSWAAFVVIGAFVDILQTVNVHAICHVHQLYAGWTPVKTSLKQFLKRYRLQCIDMMWLLPSWCWYSMKNEIYCTYKNHYRITVEYF